MGYLQPWMWWAVPAVLLPLIIHFLNRLRYRTVPWAAMLFLLKANRDATRRAKIRQYLLLACRMLVLLFLIWAMTRPLVGGWLGSAAGGAPETVLILLDRSASMEARAEGQPETKRAHALALLTQAAKQSTGSRFVFLENVLRQPLEIADASSLAGMQLAESTDTIADIPAMLRAALEYLTRNKPGSAEIWIASDLQASNWRPESPEWQDLAARFAGLPQDLRIRVLDFAAPPGRNLSVAVKAAEVRMPDLKSGTGQLSLTLDFKSSTDNPGTVPLLITRDETKSQMDVALRTAVQRQNFKFDVPRTEAGWGKVEIPADDVLSDNVAYFVHAPSPSLRAVVVGEGDAVARARLAAAPDPTRPDRVAEVLPSARADGIAWKETSLVIWAAPAPSASQAKALQTWVEGGGVLLCFPPVAEERTGPLGLSWGEVERAPATQPYRIVAWEELEGPLSRTESGATLPLSRLEVSQRRIPTIGEPSHSHGTFADGRPFLVSRKVGAGQVFACSTLPQSAWSNLGEGIVLVPMMQRLLVLGGQHISPPVMGTVGEWSPGDPEQVWTAVETDRRRDWRWHAGVYGNGSRRIALNRPEAEDAPELVERPRLPELLKGIRLTLMEQAWGLKTDRLQSEIWPWMIVLVMIFMCVEMLLATSRMLLPARPSVKEGARPSTKREPVGAGR